MKHPSCHLFAAALLLGLLAGAPLAAVTPDAPVTLTPTKDRVTLGNGIVSFAILKTNGNILDLNYGGTPLFAEPGYLDWHAAGGYTRINGAVFSVVCDPASNRGEMAEVCIAQSGAGNARSPVDVELHYVLRRGESGLNCFAVFTHHKDYPATGVGTIRWTLRLDDNVFDFINLDEERRRVMPPAATPTKSLGPKESLQFTEGPFKGGITDKYHHFVDVGDHFVHGWTSTSKNIGCWIASGSNESVNGGPTKQTNAAHFGRMLFKILGCGHYGSGDVSLAAGEEWRKIYGPWMLYVNTGADRDALWTDAKKQASSLRASWPPAWLRRDDFPSATERGTIKGKLSLSDPQDPQASPAGAWVGLAAPSPDWQKQTTGYQFWVHADADGNFTIPAVRPGDYTLYAFTNGVMDELRRDDIKVTAGKTADLGTLDWKPVRYGKQFWQIGTPDRTAKEFRHGDDYRHWGLWLKYPEDFPDGVNFTIGKSRERTDWNYAQVNVLKDGKWTGTTWNIRFDLAEPPESGTATLRLALASTQNAVLHVSLNGRQLGRFRTASDNAMIRAGIHGQYSEEDVSFDAALLKSGTNILSLEQSAAGNNQKNVMYDCVRLEVDDSRPFSSADNAGKHHTPPPLRAPAEDNED